MNNQLPIFKSTARCNIVPEFARLHKRAVDSRYTTHGILFVYSLLISILILSPALVSAQACTMSSLTATATTCDPATNTYSVNGSVVFTNPPATGVLTVRIANGQSVQFDAPFTSPQSYSLTGLNSDGVSHAVEATFSVNPSGSSCSTSISYTAPVSCLLAPTCKPGSTQGFEEFTATKEETVTNINNFAMTGIKYFDTHGGTRTLTKVLLTFSTNTKQSAIIETKDAESAEFEFNSTSTSSIKITTVGTPLITTATAYNSGIYPMVPGIPVPAQGSWPGDNVTGFTINTMGSLVDDAMVAMTDPRATADWVTALTGDPTTDDDILYIAPIFQDRTGNQVYTAAGDLANFIGTGDIDFRYNATGSLHGSGPGNFATRIRTVASGQVTVRYYYCETTSVLPVDLTRFTANKLEEKVNLSWTTANEKDFDRFELQKSKDAKEFGTLVSVNGNNSGIYNYVDSSPLQGLNYYRLKMVDMDGSFKFSKTISINFEKGGSYISVENPASNGEFSIMTNLERPSFTLVSVGSQNIKISTIETETNRFTVRADHALPGIYFLRILSNGKLVTKKVLIP